MVKPRDLKGLMRGFLRWGVSCNAAYPRHEMNGERVLFVYSSIPGRIRGVRRWRFEWCWLTIMR